MSTKTKTSEELFAIENLDLLTKDEANFNKNYVKKLQQYCDGNVENHVIKNLTAGAATIAKRQQTRGGVAALKWAVEQALSNNA